MLTAPLDETKRARTPSATTDPSRGKRAAIVDPVPSPRAARTRSTFRLHQGDAVAWLRSLPGASVDLIITDPPYESLEKHRAIGTTTRLKHSDASSNDWFSIFPNERFGELFRELWRVLARNAHLYLFCDAETMFVAKPIAEAAGFRFWKPLVWDKKRIGMGYHYRSRYELVLFFEKGKRKLADLSVPDVIEAPRIHDGYPTEKPVGGRADVLIAQSSSRGELVVDPFMGAGSWGRQRSRSGGTSWGTTSAEKALAITRERLVAAGGAELVHRPPAPRAARRVRCFWASRLILVDRDEVREQVLRVGDRVGVSATGVVVPDRSPYQATSVAARPAVSSERPGTFARRKSSAVSGATSRSVLPFDQRIHASPQTLDSKYTTVARRRSSGERRAMSRPAAVGSPDSARSPRIFAARR